MNRVLVLPGRPFGLPLGAGIVTVLLAALVAAGAALVVAQLGVKTQLVIAGLVLLCGAVIVSRDKPLALLVVLTLSVQFMFRKSFGPISTTDTSGPPSVYLTTVDGILVVLYVWWALERPILRDLWPVLAGPMFLIPLACTLAGLPSLFVANNATLVLAELTRGFFCLALYLYVACRVRSRGDVVWVFGALALITITQFAIASLQFKTGSSLGLEVLGSGTESDIQAAARELSLGDSRGGILRPPGTVLHAVLLGSLMVMTSMPLLGLALHLERIWPRLACVAVAAAGCGAIVLALARAPAFGLAIAAPWAVLVALRRRHLPWRAVWITLSAALMALIVLWSPISKIASANLGTDHFWTEVDVRLELNAVAVNMINSSPIVGIGLNQSEEVLETFEPYGVQYPGYPAHNLYLLVASETGIVGLLGWIAMMVTLFVPGVLLMRLQDRFLAGVGAGITAMLVAVCFQELLVFSLRFDVTRTVFWLLVGLSVACWRLARREGLFASAAV
jgi:hypothetical protein